VPPVLARRRPLMSRGGGAAASSGPDHLAPVPPGRDRPPPSPSPGRGPPRARFEGIAAATGRPPPPDRDRVPRGFRGIGAAAGREPDRRSAPPGRGRPPMYRESAAADSEADRPSPPPGRDRPRPMLGGIGAASGESNHPDPAPSWSETGMPLRLREAIASVRRISNDGRLGAAKQAAEALPVGLVPENGPAARMAAARRRGAPIAALAVATALVLLGALGLGLFYGGPDSGGAALPARSADPPESTLPPTQPGTSPVVSRPLPPIKEIVRIPRLPTPITSEAEAPLEAPPADQGAAGALPLPPPPKPAPSPTGPGERPSGSVSVDGAVDALLREVQG
jgi:hypothetical protein